MKKLLHMILTIIVIVTSNQNLAAQANPNPCTFPGVKCQNGGGNGMINSFGSKNIEYTNPGRSMPFWFAYGDTLTNTIDTSTNAAFAISSVFGPGDMTGHNGTQPAKYCYLNDIEFSKAGHYDIGITMTKGMVLMDKVNMEVLPEKEIGKNACGKVKGNKIIAKGACGNIITVDAVFPIFAAVVDSATGKIDTTYSGTMYVNKISGPGMLYGTLSMSGGRWFEFNNLHFSTEGNYTIKIYEQDSSKYENATANVIVSSTTDVIELKTAEIFAFPNPFIDQLNVVFDHSNQLISYQIYDQTGKVVLQKLNENTGDRLVINTQNLSDGVYFLNIQSSANEELKNIIILKQ